MSDERTKRTEVIEALRRQINEMETDLQSGRLGSISSYELDCDIKVAHEQLARLERELAAEDPQPA